MTWSYTATVSIDTNHTRFELGQNTKKNQHYERPGWLDPSWNGSNQVAPRVKTPEHQGKEPKKMKRKDAGRWQMREELQKGALNGKWERIERAQREDSEGVDCVGGGGGDVGWPLSRWTESVTNKKEL